MKKNNLIPFGFLPVHWGLSGVAKEIAKAYYEYDGYDLDQKIIEINYKDDEYKKSTLTLSSQLKHNIIDQETYDLKSLEIDKEFKVLDDKQYELNLLDFKLKYNKISELAHNKQTATVKEEPWVKIINVGFNAETPNQGEFELDWNDIFVQELKDAGYEGIADEQIVNNWLSEICKNIAMETYSGVGNFDEIVENGSNSIKHDNKGLKEYK